MTFNRISHLEIFNKSNEINLFKSEFKSYLFFTVFIVLFLLVSIIFKIKKKTKNHNGFNDFETRFLNLLISSQSVNSSEFVSVLREIYSNHNDDHLTRIKMK